MKAKTLVVCLAAALTATAQEKIVEGHVMMARASGEAGQTVIEVVSAEVGLPGKVVKGAPYTAEAITESTQILADGNRITRKSTALLARDSEGRTRRQDRFAGPGASDSKESSELVFINDPVAKVNWTLDSATRTARKLSLREGKSNTGGAAWAVAYGHASEAGLAVRHEGVVATSHRPEPGRTESLGKRNIEGVIAEGTRTTRTIPAGEIGNERPIEVVSERWYSPELQTVVLSKRSDPLIGETSYRLTNIVRSEPPRSLFEPPPDYQVKETSGDVHIIRSVKE
jgi:hypothetical protein